MKKIAADRIKLIEEIECHYAARKEAIRNRLMEFKSVPVSEYFYELLYCLFTPQSSALHADRAVLQLRAVDFQHRDINPESILRKKEQYIRFHRMKSKYAIQMKIQYPDIMEKTISRISAFEKRDWLVRNVNGLGYKEATHFLRNIGKNGGLAILDRHILRTLINLNVIGTIPVSMGRNRYLEIEGRFMSFAENIGIILDELDLVFWSMGTGEIRK
jgi:N-glycosylase/DNA lyase